MADTLPASVTGTPTTSAEDPGKPPTGELGAVAQSVGSPGGWAAFLDEAEYVPELTFPNSVLIYHRMRSDTQIEALHLGTTQPIREFRWMIDPNKADSKLVENVATDLGLPIKGEEADEGVKRAKGKFDFDTCLSDALLGPLYGFMDFEIVGRIEEALDWRMSKLSPRHPRTIQMFQQDDHGGLLAIKQIFGPNFSTTPPPIPSSKLLHLTWRPEAGTHVGRAMLRSMYREWLVKEKVMRIAVVNLERAGGVPVVEGPQGASNAQLADLANMARQFKVAEGGGGAIPFGSKLNLVGGSSADSIGLMTYCDEAMARVWALMLVQLGQTTTGSRALGGEFAIYAARAQRLMGKWIATAFNDFLDRYTEWNDPLADYAPRLAFEPSQPEGLSVTDLVSLVDAGVLTVDPELEEWMRSEFSLPEKPEDEDIGQLTDAEKALILNSRNPPPVVPGQAPAPGQVPPGSDPFNPAYHATPGPRKSLDPTAIAPTVAKTGTRDIPRIVGGLRASLTLPDRVLRREPTPNEIQAAVDFRALDQAHATAVASLHHDYINGTLPTQIGHLADQVRGGVSPNDLKAPVVRLDQLTEHLKTAAHSGVEAAVREAQVQGVPFNEADVVSAHIRAGARAERQAEHVADLNANGLTLGAKRRAGRLASKVRGREAVAKDLEAHLTAQKHVFERENLKGAVTVAQNGGRFEAMQQVDPAVATASYEASEILDDRTCGPCEAIDGTQYEDLDEAEADYSGGGYVDCEGGPNCRGTIVATYGEQNPVGGEGDLREAEPAYTGGEAPGDEGGTPTPETPPPEPEPSAEGATPVAGEAGALVEAGGGVLDAALSDPAVASSVADVESANAAFQAGKAGDPGRMEQIRAYTATRAAALPEWQASLKAALGDARPGFGTGEFKIEGDATPEQRAALAEAAKWYPREWVEASNNFGPMGLSDSGGYLREGRGGVSFLGITTERPQINVHELMHRFQHVYGDRFTSIEAAFRDARATGPETQLDRVDPETAYTGPGARAVPGDFLDPYMGRVYDDGRGEVLPLASEWGVGLLVGQPGADPELMKLWLGTLRDFDRGAATDVQPAVESKAGPLLAKAQQITTHDEAVAFLKHEVGIPGEVEFGPKLEKAAQGKYKPGSQGELNQQHAMDFIRQLTESVADARDTFGEASRVDNIVSNTRAREVYRQITHRAKGKALGPRAAAAIRTWPTLGRNELIFNDGRSLEQLTAKDVSERNGGYTSKATTDPRGIIMHEMGHSLENGLPGLASAFPRMLADSGLASTAQARGMAPFISQYAATVPAETWAESFATLMRPGGVDADFSYTGTNERIRELYPDADAKTKEALGKLRDNFNAWLDEHHPDTPHMPER